MQQNLFNLKYPTNVIQQKTKEIYKKILENSSTFNNPNFTKFSVKDLKYIFALYDSYFFDNFFKKNHKEKLYFRLSTRMTSAGGKTIYNRRTKFYEIVLSMPLLFQTFDGIKREVEVNGLICYNRLEAAMRIIEHEIIHLLELLILGNSSCSNPRFKNLSYNIFNHRDTKHKLVTKREIASEKFDLKIGDKVMFEFEGQLYKGFINHITKRATVMVENPKGMFCDSKGNRYHKYYIPIQCLQKDNT